MAQAIRAILLARAIAATFVGRRANNAVSHGRRLVPWSLAYRITASAPAVNRLRRYRSPCLVIPPSRSFVSVRGRPKPRNSCTVYHRPGRYDAESARGASPRSSRNRCNLSGPKLLCNGNPSVHGARNGRRSAASLAENYPRAVSQCDRHARTFRNQHASTKP
jgi:hypothetical protein